ncbi:hypothetical protein F8M41_005583 [Gigaspora margarita]|uniref:Transmembrane protein n=1 Tax=Gigaspora margarita TaxID=4874 RepID=A0A8H3X973_GIGMA|nr:hypothetical protein F8M41_005583 [Gigaspora margarita]
MFLIDTLFDRGTAEPCWFKITRIAVAFGLSIIALLYAFNQIISLLSNQFIVAITEEPIIPPSMPGVLLCTYNLSFINYKCDYNFMTFSPDIYGNIQMFTPFRSCEILSSNSNCINFRFNSSRQYNFDSALMIFNITLAPALSTANVSFNLSEYLYPSPLFSFPGQDSALNSKNGPSSVNFSKIGISDHQLYVKFDTMNVNNNTYTDYNYPSILLEAGDSSIITISPTIKGSYYHNLKRFLGYSGDRDQFYLTPTITTLPKLTDERQIQFAIIQRQYLRNEIQISHSIPNIVANIGGFCVALSSIYIYLFGRSKLSPWGILQKYILVCGTCRRSLKRKLAKRYVAYAGIPLSQKVSNRRNNATLEDRVQMLETMLQEYYLDNYQWELLRKSILKYDRLQRQYDQMTLKEIIDSDSEII